MCGYEYGISLIMVMDIYDALSMCGGGCGVGCVKVRSLVRVLVVIGHANNLVTLTADARVDDNFYSYCCLSRL